MINKVVEIVSGDDDYYSYKKYINQFDNAENNMFTAFVNYILDLAILNKDNNLIENKNAFDIYSLIETIEKVI